jgi:hypothetical protein
MTGVISQGVQRCFIRAAIGQLAAVFNMLINDSREFLLIIPRIDYDNMRVIERLSQSRQRGTC